MPRHGDNSPAGTTARSGIPGPGASVSSTTKSAPTSPPAATGTQPSARVQVGGLPPRPAASRRARGTPPAPLRGPAVAANAASRLHSSSTHLTVAFHNVNGIGLRDEEVVRAADAIIIIIIISKVNTAYRGPRWGSA